MICEAAIQAEHVSSILAARERDETGDSEQGTQATTHKTETTEDYADAEASLPSQPQLAPGSSLFVFGDETKQEKEQRAKQAADAVYLQTEQAAETVASRVDLPEDLADVSRG